MEFDANQELEYTESSLSKCIPISVNSDITKGATANISVKML